MKWQYMVVGAIKKYWVYLLIGFFIINFAICLRLKEYQDTVTGININTSDMAINVWGLLAKSLIDGETVEQAIARLIAAHEADETAHLAVGESLQSHKASEVIDHLVDSIISDKIMDGEITSNKITNNQILAKDFRTAADVGAGVDGVKMVPTGIEMWQGGEKKVDIPVSGDPSFAGIVSASGLKYLTDTVMSYFESLDGWYNYEGSNLAGIGELQMSTNNVTNAKARIMADAHSLYSIKNPNFQTRLSFAFMPDMYCVFGIGILKIYDDYIEEDLNGFGYEFNDEVISAYSVNGANEERTSITIANPNMHHTYSAGQKSGVITFYVDGVLVATHSDHVVVGQTDMFVYYIETLANSSKYVFPQWLIVSQDK